MEISIYLSLYDSNFSKHFNFCLKLIRRYVDGDRYLSFSSVAQIFSKILFLVLMEHDVIQEFRILFEQNFPKNFNFCLKLIECYLNREFRMINSFYWNIFIYPSLIWTQIFPKILSLVLSNVEEFKI